MPRSGLLAGCALGALLATLPAVAEAQAFAGTPTVVAGDASISDNPGGLGVPPSTDIFVLQPETVINWTVTNVAAPSFTFQPSGTVATFEGDDLADFTVLNRILPFDGNGAAVGSAALLDGTVESYVNPVGGSRDIGGQVWFYSPTGIIAGPNALFNVGSLILTTDDIQFVAAAGSDPGSIYGPGGTVQFRGLKDSSGFVEIQPGAQINALGNLTGSDAYVALVAPRVVQNGFVSADGNIAYIAAEEVDMTINGGLFDFTVTVGTTDPEGIVHGGTTTGPASTDFFADQQRISMVAVPKNDALTMLLQGTIGYSPALNAFNEGSSVVLAAGFNTDHPFQARTSPPATIDIGNATFQNSLTAWASDAILVHPRGGTVTFGGNTSLNAANSIDITAETREFIIGDADLTATAGVPGQGGTIDVLAETSDFQPGGVIDIAGSFELNASSSGILGVVEPPADQFGGRITLTADGGVIEAANIYAVADANGDFADPLGGLGQGGAINLIVEGFTGVISADFVDIYAGGYGGGSDETGGDGIGGSISLFEDDGIFDFGTVFLGARGGGGDSSGVAGNGTGGTVVVDINQRAQNWEFLGIDTSSFGGGPAIESNGLSGSASGGEDGAILRISGPGSLTINSDLVMTSNAYMNLNGADGYTGEGGKVTIEVTDGGLLSVTGTLFAHASALLGSSEFSFFGTPDTTPTQTGGNVEITADSDGRITALALDVHADAEGLFAQTAAGSATGGEVTLSALNGGSFQISDEATGLLATISANAYGAPGPIASDAQGGLAQIIVEDGEFVVNGDLEISADALGGEFFSPPPEGFGFNATGGTASIELRAGTLGTAAFSANDVAITAIGDGTLNISMFSGEGIPPPPAPEPIAGDGGDGTGGSANLTIAGGEFIVGDLTLDSSGMGGGSGVSPEDFPFASGDGLGGSTLFQITGGQATTVGSLNLVSNGTGGDSNLGPAAAGTELATLAGNGAGGSVTLQLDGGTLSVTDTLLDANGFGGRGMDHVDDGEASDGGIGTGGTAALTTAADWTGFFSTSTLSLYANGDGGQGGYSDPDPGDPPNGIAPTSRSGDGGDGTGGFATVDLADGEFSLGNVELSAIGTGADSGDPGSGFVGSEGGQASGGYTRFALIDSAGPSGLPDTRTIDYLQLDATGYGGYGSTFLWGGTAGEVDFTVSVLDPDSALDLTGSLYLIANGFGSLGAPGIEALISGAPLNVGGGIQMYTGSPIAVTALEPLTAAFEVALSGLSIDTTGLIQSGSEMYVDGFFGINADRLTSGSTTLLRSFFGPVVIVDLNSADQVDASGQSIDIRSSGSLDFLLAEATAGDLFIETVDDLGLATADATGAVTLRSTDGSVTGTGTVVAGGSATVEGQAGVSLASLESGGATQLGSADGSVEIDDLVSAGTVAVTAGDSVDIVGSEGLEFSTAQAANTMSIVTEDDLAFDSVSAGNDLTLSANQGALTVSGDVSGGFTQLNAEFDIAISGNLNVGGTLVATTERTFTVTGDASTGDAHVTADRGITMASLTSGEITVLEAADGNIVVPELLTGGRVTAIAGDVDIGSTGGLLFDEATATDGDVTIRTAGDLAANELSASQALDLNSGGTFSLFGEARGNTISVTSSDIEIGDEAQLGVRGVTSTITLLNGDQSNETYIGEGTVEEESWVLDAAEARRLFADNSIFIGIDVDEGPVADVDIGDLQMSFGGTGNIGTGGTLEISSPGEIHITGDVELTASGADDTFRIDPRLIALHTDTGSISMFSGEGANANGRIELLADTVIAATDSVIDQLDTLTDLDQITELLSEPGGTGDTISAGTIDISVVDGVYIQNSGASDEYADRRGFAAGALNIETESDDTQIAINGQILRPVTLGGPVTGLDVVPLVSINGEPASAGGQFDPRSTINGCVIGTDCAFVPEPEPRPIDPPSDDDLNPVDPIDPPGGFIVAPLIELAGTEPLIEPPLVDEPITGVGNDDLWQPPCDDPDEDGACPEDGEQQ